MYILVLTYLGCQRFASGCHSQDPKLALGSFLGAILEPDATQVRPGRGSKTYAPKHLIWGNVTGFRVSCARFRVLYAPRSIVLDPHVGGVATKAT